MEAPRIDLHCAHALWADISKEKLEKEQVAHCGWRLSAPTQIYMLVADGEKDVWLKDWFDKHLLAASSSGERIPR